MQILLLNLKNQQLFIQQEQFSYSLHQPQRYSTNMTSAQILQHSIVKKNLSQNELIRNPNPSRFQYSRSSTKRIYQSVFRIIDFDDVQEPTFQYQDTNSSKIQTLLKDDNALYFMYQKMKDQGVLDHYPVLKIYCQQSNTSNFSSNLLFDYNNLYQLEFSDILGIFERFGDLNKIVLSPDMKFGYVFFTTFHSAYVAYKLLNGFQFSGKGAKLLMNWIDGNEFQYLLPNIGSYVNSINWHLMYRYCSNRQDQAIPSTLNNLNNQKQNKLTCRYEIQIHNERDFQVARRIIGSKGCHMKRIIQECIQLARNHPFYKSNPKCLDNVNQLLKLRLRGRGSGYKQGPLQQQSDQTLHLCVSAKDQICFQISCQKVEKLIENVYQQYFQYTLQQNGKGIRFSISKNSYLTPGQDQIVNQYEYQTQTSYDQGHGYYTQQELNSMHITPHKICELLQLRNKARRQLNFLEADRIRNFLKNCGVCLIDEKGRRGKAMQVTTWKYMF